MSLKITKVILEWDVIFDINFLHNLYANPKSERIDVSRFS